MASKVGASRGDTVRACLVILALLFTVCNGDPPPPPPPPTCQAWGTFEGCECPVGTERADVLGVCAPPRVDRHIDLGAARGVTAFSLALRDVTYIKEFAYHIQRNSWNVMRVGAQTAHDWCAQSFPMELAESDLLMHMRAAGYLPCGPAHGTPQWEANLNRLLDTTARVHNIGVQLIPTFTYKSHNECNQTEWREDQEGCQAKNVIYFNKMFDRVNAVVKAGSYQHVVWDVFNEPVHPLSQHIKDEDVRAIMLHMKTQTTLPMGVDYHGGGEGEDWRGRYPYIWRDVSNYLAFHPPRNPTPSYAIMEAAQDKYNYVKPVWADETLCWASQKNIDKYGLKGKGTIAMNGYGTEEQRMDQVVKHLRDINRVGWSPTFHSIWGIECIELGRLPKWEEIAQ